MGVGALASRPGGRISEPPNQGKSRVDAYIVKPFRGDTLLKKIYSVLGDDYGGIKIS